MNDVTRILSRLELGDSAASRELLPLVYDELRQLARARMANERSDHTLQATALVHEAYVRLVDADAATGWDSRGHFFSAAAEAMRRILIESARSKQTVKRGGGSQPVAMVDDLVADRPVDGAQLIDFDEALADLAAQEPQVAELVKLHVFAGLSIRQAGEMLGMPKSTAQDNWQFARAWFASRLDA